MHIGEGFGSEKQVLGHSEHFRALGGLLCLVSELLNLVFPYCSCYLICPPPLKPTPERTKMKVGHDIVQSYQSMFKNLYLTASFVTITSLLLIHISR